MACGFVSAPAWADDASGYTIYPTPHKISYATGSFLLKSSAGIVVEQGVDADTRARLDEVLKLKGIAATEKSAPSAQSGALEVLVGIRGSGGKVDTLVQKLIDSGAIGCAEDLFDNTDSYLLAAVPGGDGAPDRLIVLGRDSDAAFYGLTTLYQVMQQLPGLSMRSFALSDWADVKSRGFIEGYYGSPWTTQDRVNLMTWGGYYKLNSYVYAPKDDPKHRSNWRDLYTDEEISSQVKPQAEAGNRSKVRFVFALAPFTDEKGMEPAFRFDSEEHYREDLAILKARYLQTIDAGVREIALLADDSTDWGAKYGNDKTYLRILTDLTDWIHELQGQTDAGGAVKYAGLKDTILYCPALWSYTGRGEGWYAQMPANVQIIMTGGRTFGIVDQQFAETFHRNTGRSPFMWVNWPCSDMARNFTYDWLTMGGHNTFLKTGVQPGALDGIMLNPMQQSEPSKQGIFMTSDYSWNLWTSKDHADRAWEDSFSFIDHNSPLPTAGSTGLRDLAMNMRVHVDNGIDGTVTDPDYDKVHKWWINHESEDFTGALDMRGILTEVKAKLDGGSATADDLDRALSVYIGLGHSAAGYRADCGDKNLWKQMEPFVGSWDDTTSAAIGYIMAAKQAMMGVGALSEATLATADATYEASQHGHKIDYLGDQKDARVGLVIITPTLESLKAFATARVAEGSDPDRMVPSCENQYVSPFTSGAIDNIVDGDLSTYCDFMSQDGDSTLKGASVTVTFGTACDAARFRFIQDDPQSSDKEYIDDGTFEYQSPDGAWHEVGGVVGRATNEFTLDRPVRLKAIRVVNNVKKDCLWRVFDLSLTKVAEPGDPLALRSLITQAEAIDSSMWTDSSREILAAALKQARACISDGSSTQARIDGEVARLSLAMNGVARYTNMTLAQLEASHRSNRSNRYTEGSYAVYQTAYNALHAELVHARDLPGGLGATLEATLASATEALAFNPTEHDRAQLAYADAARYQQNAYTPASWATFRAVYDQLGALLQSDPSGARDPDCYAGLVKKLASAISNLEPKVEPGVSLIISGEGVSGGRLDLKVGASVQLKATVADGGAPRKGADQAIEWKSSDTTILRIDTSGKATAVGQGKATVSASAKVDDATISAKLEVTVSAEPKPAPSPDGSGGKGLPSSGDLTAALVIGTALIATVPIGAALVLRGRSNR